MDYEMEPKAIKKRAQQWNQKILMSGSILDPKRGVGLLSKPKLQTSLPLP